MPWRVKKKMNLTLIDGNRMSIDSCFDAPMSTAGPFTAAMIGFTHWKMRSVTDLSMSRFSLLAQAPRSIDAGSSFCGREGVFLVQFEPGAKGPFNPCNDNGAYSVIRNRYTERRNQVLCRLH